MKKIRKIINSRENVNNFLIAFLFCTPMLSFIINMNNIIPYLLMAISLFLIIINKKTLKKTVTTVTPIIVFFFLFFILFLFSNFIRLGWDKEFIQRVLYFAIFGVVSCFCIKIVLNSEEGLKTRKIVVGMLGIYAILSLFIMDINFWTYNVAERMAISYYMLPLYVGILLEFFMDKKRSVKKYILKYVLYLIIFFPYFDFFMKYISRGVVLALMCCFIICLLCNQKKKRKMQMLIVLLVIIVILMVFALDILKAVQSILKSVNISFYAIDKTVRLLEEGNLGDGRDTLYGNALDGIKEHPILGNGIGQYKTNYGTYPHNLLLQLWYEGGIFYLLICSIPILYAISRVIFSDKIEWEIKYLYILVFSVSIIRLMLSYEYWKDIFYWICFYLSLEIMKRKKGKHEK